MSSEAPPPPALDLRKRGWLARLLRLYLEHHDPAASVAAVAEVSAAFPDEPRETQAGLLALRRLEGLGLRPRQQLSPGLYAAIAEGLAADELTTVGVLVTQWDILKDIACLHGNRSRSVAEALLEVLVITALGLKDYALARRLHQAHLEAAGGGEVDVAKLAAGVEAKLARRGQLPRAHAAASIGIGLVYMEARALASIASLYYERAAVEEEGIERLHALSAAEKVGLIEVLANVAWADGAISPAERALVEQQVHLSGVDKKRQKSLLKLLDAPPEGDPLAHLVPLEAGPRRFILEQAILLSLVDDAQDPAEVALLRSIAARLGGTPEELEAVMVEVAAFYEQNRQLIRDFGPVSGSLGRLRRLVLERAQAAVRQNMRAIVQELKETGELARLLGAASVRELDAGEHAKVKAQLADLAKTVPALAIFILPGGALLLPALIKLLPFNLLPTAFSEGAAAAAAEIGASEGSGDDGREGADSASR